MMKKTKEKYIIGIDIGLQGAITVIDNTTDNIILSVKMPVHKNNLNKNVLDESKLIEIIKEYNNSFICFEKVSAMPGQGVSSMFMFGYEFGFITAVSEIYANNYISIHPKKWQNFLINKYFNDDINKNFLLYNYDYISKTIKDENFKSFFIKTCKLKSSKISKIKSLYLYYLINTNNLNSIKYKDNNIVDSFLLAKYCKLIQFV